MANIEHLLDDIRKNKYCVDMKETFCNALNEANANAEKIESTVKKIKNEITSVNANAEIIDARGGKETLSERLNEFDEQLDTIARKTKGYININSYYCLNPNCNGECGCIKGDGVHDDTSGIKKAISDIKNVYNTLKWNGNYNTLAFPNGEYRITSQIKVPYFIHFKSLGNVVFLCEVPND